MNLVYMAKPIYGGWVTFTSHLALKCGADLYKIGGWKFTDTTLSTVTGSKAIALGVSEHGTWSDYNESLLMYFNIRFNLIEKSIKCCKNIINKTIYVNFFEFY